MIQSKQKVKDLCDKLMDVNPEQILIDLVQEEIEDALNGDNVTPDEIGSLVYKASILQDVYSQSFEKDVAYLVELIYALDDWHKDAEFANRSLGLDPNV